MTDNRDVSESCCPSRAWTEEFKAKLAEASRRDAELDRQLCEDFNYVDAEVFGRDDV